jgi:1-acyl-sn-glycerol-3-phosphate acyltransferase
MKKEWFFFPLKYLLKSYGGIPVNRSKKTSVSDQMVGYFKNRKSFQLAVTPEGTRKRTNKWKSGFYYIAEKAEVPIALAHIDYAKKEVGIETIIYPTGDKNSDIDKIKQYYKDVTARHPHKFAI